MQAQSQVISSSSALIGKTEEAAALKTQLRRESAQRQEDAAQAAISVTAAAQAKAAVQQQLALEQQQHASTKQHLIQLEADVLEYSQQRQSEPTLQKQGLTGAKLTSEEAQGQQSSSASALPAQVLSHPCPAVHLLHAWMFKNCQAPTVRRRFWCLKLLHACSGSTCIINDIALLFHLCFPVWCS